MEKENKLIAEFMGYVDNGDSEFLIHPETNYDHSVNDKDWFLYNSSWDWLIPVVRKLNEVVDIKKGEEGIVNGLIMGDIEYTYSHIVDCIKWYNENK